MGLILLGAAFRLRHRRTAELGPRRLEDEIAWIEKYQEMLEGRLNRLEEYLERTKGRKS